MPKATLPIASLLTAAALLLGTTLTAQATWIVDANNGPGTDFTSLQIAIYSAAPGDRLFVRAGTYQPGILDRPLAIVGDGNPVVAGNGGYSPGFLVQSLPAGSLTTITGMVFAAGSLSNESLRVQSGPGTIVLDGVESSLSTSVGASSDVRFAHSHFLQGLKIENSTCLLDECQVLPDAGQTVFSGLNTSSSHVVLNRCQVTGRSSATLFATAAIESTSSTLVLTDDGTGSIVAGIGALPIAAIRGTGTAQIDPHVLLVPSGGAPAVTGVAATTRARPSLAITAGPAGGTIDLDLFGTTGEIYVEAVGLALPAIYVPGFDDTIWVQPLMHWTAGVFNATGHALEAIPVPNLPLVPGFSFTWQAAAFSQTGITLSNAVSYVHPM